MTWIFRNRAGKYNHMLLSFIRKYCIIIIVWHLFIFNITFRLALVCDSVKDLQLNSVWRHQHTHIHCDVNYYFLFDLVLF